MPDLFESPKSIQARDQRFNSDTSAQPPGHTPEPMVAKNANIPIMHTFSSSKLRPLNISFQMQEENETVLLLLHKSWIANLHWIVLTIIFIFIPVGLFFIRSSFLQLNFPLGTFVILALFYYLLVTTYFFVNFVTWYYNAAIITNKRIVDIDFHQLLFKDIAETKFELVQDVSYQEIGTFQNIFDYGHVLVQTAGTEETFEFYDLPHPAKVVELVESLIGGNEHEP